MKRLALLACLALVFTGPRLMAKSAQQAASPAVNANHAYLIHTAYTQDRDDRDADRRDEQARRYWDRDREGRYDANGNWVARHNDFRDADGRWHRAGDWQDRNGVWHARGDWRDTDGRWRRAEERHRRHERKEREEREEHEH